MSKKSKIARPNRDPDHYSKRGVPYWWAPEWIRGTAADCIYQPEDKLPLEWEIVINANGELVHPQGSYGRIHAVKNNGDVELHMKSKEGKLTYIQGSIQKEFKRWHTDRSVDYLLFGLDPDEIIANDE